MLVYKMIFNSKLFVIIFTISITIIYGNFFEDIVIRGHKALVNYYDNNNVSLTKFECKNREILHFQPTFIDDPNIEEKLKISQPITFIIHGWNQSISDSFISRMSNQLLKLSAVNVCLVNWLSFGCYHTVARKTQNVGESLGNFIKYLTEQHGVSFDEITIIGHGMGAHIAGFAGEHHNGKIGTIFATDPASFLFSDEDPLTRLDPSDAKFIQTINTFSYLFGGSEWPRGHQEFYANLGALVQPACFDRNFFDSFWCSHDMSIELFICSMDTRNKFVSIENSDVHFGYHSNRSFLGTYTFLSSADVNSCYVYQGWFFNR